MTRSGGYFGSSESIGRAQVGADVEQVVLHLPQRHEQLLGEAADRHGDAERGVALVGVGVGREPDVGLADAAEVAERRRAVVAGLGVDPGQVHGHGPTVVGPQCAVGPARRGLAAARRRHAAGPTGSASGVARQALASCAVVEHFAVHGGARLVGSVDVVGAKNSVLKLMAAALLAEGTTTITNCPEILDVPLMADVLRSLGCAVVVDHGTVTIDVPAEPGAQADYRSVSKLRASVCVLGPLVARCRRAVVPLPGGDAIGSRPLDMHQAGLRKLGATTEIEHGRVVAEAGDLHGAQIWLDFPSVGRHREHPDGRRARRGHHGDRQRRARAGDRRPVHDAAADGRQDRRRRAARR